MRTRAGAGLPLAWPVRSVAGAAYLSSAARRRGPAQPAADRYEADPQAATMAAPAAGRHAVAASGPAARLAAAMMACLAARLAMMVCPAPAAGRCVVAVDRASDRAAGRCGGLVDLASCLAFPAESRKEVAARHDAAVLDAVARRAAVPGAAVPELHAVRAVARAAERDVARCEERVELQAVVGVEAAARKVAAGDAAPAAVAEHRVACVRLRCAFCVARRFRARPAPGRG
jgi:hypothetical protein